MLTTKRQEHTRLFAGLVKPHTFFLFNSIKQARHSLHPTFSSVRKVTSAPHTSPIHTTFFQASQDAIFSMYSCSPFAIRIVITYTMLSILALFNTHSGIKYTTRTGCEMKDNCSLLQVTYTCAHLATWEGGESEVKRKETPSVCVGFFCDLS